MRSREWLDRAVCRDLDDDGELFFPDLGDLSPAQREMTVNTAKAHCRRCPVQDECLLYALSTGEQHGIWGGMTAAEREALLRAGAGEESA